MQLVTTARDATLAKTMSKNLDVLYVYPFGLLADNGGDSFGELASVIQCLQTVEPFIKARQA